MSFIDKDKMFLVKLSVLRKEGFLRAHIYTHAHTAFLSDHFITGSLKVPPTLREGLLLSSSSQKSSQRHTQRYVL